LEPFSPLAEVSARIKVEGSDKWIAIIQNASRRRESHDESAVPTIGQGER
jgi:hypothetical protein